MSWGVPHSRLCQVVRINCLASACTRALFNALSPWPLWLQGWVDLIDVLITELGNQVRTVCLLNPAACSQQHLAASGVAGRGSSELLLQCYSTGMQQTSLHDHHLERMHSQIVFPLPGGCAGQLPVHAAPLSG